MGAGWCWGGRIALTVSGGPGRGRFAWREGEALLGMIYFSAGCFQCCAAEPSLQGPEPQSGSLNYGRPGAGVSKRVLGALLPRVSRDDAGRCWGLRWCSHCCRLCVSVPLRVFLCSAGRW